MIHLISWISARSWTCLMSKSDEQELTGACLNRIKRPFCFAGH